MCEPTPIDSRIPRSALPHRPIHAVKTSQPEVPRASRFQSQAQEPQKKSHPPALSPPGLFPFPELSQDQRHRLFLVGTGMLATFLLIMLGNLTRLWLSTTWDNLHYGEPRTFQIDAFVGHEKGDRPSHFIALNQTGRIEVIELPGGDATHMHTYLGPQLIGPGADMIPVTLSFIDVRHDHQPDMVVQFQDIEVLFRNALGTFHPV